MTPALVDLDGLGGQVLAHGLGGRSDLPVAPWLATYAGAMVVAISFFAASALWTQVRYADGGGGIRAASLRAFDSTLVRAFGSVVGVVLLFAFLAVAFAGPDDMGRTNPAPTWFYVWFWVGLVPVSLLFGPVWRRINPLRTLAALLSTLFKRAVYSELPRRWGYTPAIVSLAAFLWLELVYDESASPRVIGIFVVVYAAIHVIGGVWFGPRWFARADGFEVYSTMLARAALVGRNSDGVIVLRNPLRGLATGPDAPNLTPVVVVVLGSTVFDGISRSAWWADLVADTGRGEYLVLGTVGLAGAVALVTLTFGAAMLLTRSRLRPTAGSSVSALFAPTLIPIAIGYTIAHYFSFALFQGQQGYLLANDPLGKGWDLLGLAGESVDYAVLSTGQISFIQVASIVVGHVVAVLSAHDRSLEVFERPHGMRGQYPLLTVMIAYTGGGIVLLAG